MIKRSWKTIVKNIAKIIFIVLIVVVSGLTLMALLLSTGCASYKIQDGEGKIISQGSANGILRTITVTEDYKNGVLVRSFDYYDDKGKLLKTEKIYGTACRTRKVSTDSNTKDILMGLNELIDTATETYEKVKP